MNSDREARQLRERVASLQAQLDRADRDNEQGAGAGVCIVVHPSDFPWPAPGDPITNIIPLRGCQVTGGDGTGATLTAAAVGPTFYAANLGNGIPVDPDLSHGVVQTLLLVTQANGISVFTYSDE